MLGYTVSAIVRQKFGSKITWLKSRKCLLPYWFKLLIYFVDNILVYDWRFGRNWLCDKLGRKRRNE